MGRSKPPTIEARRLRVAELLAAQPGISVRQIARAVGCGVTTAQRDAQAVRAEWAARRVALVESRAAEDLARADAAIAALWPQVLAGKGWAIDRLVALLGYRAKVLGLDAPRPAARAEGDAQTLPHLDPRLLLEAATAIARERGLAPQTVLDAAKAQMLAAFATAERQLATVEVDAVRLPAPEEEAAP